MNPARILGASSSLLALAFALSGCPSPAPATSASPERSPTPSPSSAPISAELKALGLIKPQLTSMAFTVGEPRYYLSLENWGSLKAVPISSYGEYCFRWWQTANAYTKSSGYPDSHSRSFTPVAAETLFEALAFTLEDQPATRKVLGEDGTVILSFPSELRGTLQVTSPETSDYHAMTSRTEYYPTETTVYIFERTMRVYEQYQVIRHDATASLEVSVSELNGAPVSGLTAAYFSVSASDNSARVPGRISALSEPRPGQYSLTATFEDLSG